MRRAVVMVLIAACCVSMHAQQLSKPTYIDLLAMGDLGSNTPPVPPAGRVVLFVSNGRICQEDATGAVNCYASFSGSSVSANTVLAGPVSGAAAAPAFRTLTATDVNIAYTNATAATSTQAQSSPVLSLSGQYWTGSASAQDTWSVQNQIANGTNGTSTLTFLHSGSSNANISFSSPVFVTGGITTSGGGHYHTACAGICAGFGFDTSTATAVLFRVGAGDAWFFGVPDLNQANTVTRIFGGTTLGANPTLLVNGSLTVTGTLSAPGVPVVVYATPSATLQFGTGIASTTMATAGSNGNLYEISAVLVTVNPGSGCTGNNTATLTVTGTDAVSGTSLTLVSVTLSYVNSMASSAPTLLNAAANSTVSYSVSSTTSGTCTTMPTYYVLPVVKKLQ